MAAERPQGSRPIDEGIVARVAGTLGRAVSGAISGAIKGASEAWFGPQQPMAPVAPPEVRGRTWDYPTDANLTSMPRGEPGESAISFWELRRLADPGLGGHDLLRLAIETRKDQMSALRWSIRAKGGKGDGGRRARKTEEALEFPDLEHDWQQWQRMVMEDSFVIDAPAIYLRPSSLGYRIPEVMDGALLKRLITPAGRTPLPEEGPAYVQRLKGMPAVHYTSDEIIYGVRNPRSWKIYGYPECEQVVNIVNVGLRRTVSQLEFYTAGSIPDLLLNAPKEWSADQILSYQQMWNAMLSGNTEERRRAQWIPGDVKPTLLKPDQLKDDFDEWIARIICFCFSLSPTALVKQVNRSVAESSKEQALEEGLEPRKLWFKGFMNRVLWKAFDARDLEFGFAEDEITDPLVKAQVFQIACGKPWMTPNEVRTKGYGDPELTPEQEEELAPPPAPMFPSFGGGAAQGGEKPPPPGEGKPPPPGEGKAQEPGEEAAPAKAPPEKVEKAAKARKTVAPLDPDRKVVAVQRELLAAAVRKLFAAQKQRLAKAIPAEMPTEKAAGAVDVVSKAKPEEELDRLHELLTEDDEDELEDLLLPRLEKVAKESAGAGLEQVGKGGIESLLDQAHERAITWAGKHAAEMVTAITDTTRDGIRGLVKNALDEGWSSDRLAEELETASAFSDERAETIARTELAFASTEGSICGWRASGSVAGRQWLTSNEPDTCQDCVDLDGKVVAIDEDFEDGDPPLHPRCRCAVTPVLSEEEDEADEGAG